MNAQSDPQTCYNCGRERRDEEMANYSPIQVILNLPLGWYSQETDNITLCPECLAPILAGQRRGEQDA